MQKFLILNLGFPCVRALDGEDLIICVAIWTLHKLWLPLTCDGLLAISIASRNRLRAASLRGAMLEDFRRILGGFGKPKWTQIDFRAIFFDVFFERVLASICHRFWEARNLKKYEKPLVFPWFLLIFEKSMFPKKRWKKLDFSSIFGGQNHENSRKNGVEKYAFFLIWFFCVFFAVFLQFSLNFGRPGPSKNLKKYEKNEFLKCSVLKDGSKRVQGRFCHAFSMVLNWFWKDLG